MLSKVTTKTATGVEKEITSIIQYHSDDLSNVHQVIAEELQVRRAKDRTYLLIRRNSSASWQKFDRKALELLILRAMKHGEPTGLSNPEASRLADDLIRIAPVAINVQRRMAPDACSYCGSVQEAKTHNQ